jgi:hypothetical protein
LFWLEKILRSSSIKNSVSLQLVVVVTFIMYISQAYGLVLQSDLKLLAAPIDTPQEADVIIRRGSIPALSQQALQAQNAIVGALSDVGQFYLKDGREVVYDVEHHLTDEQIAPDMMGAAMSVILVQRGNLVLHASAVSDGQSAIAFLGHSGYGKSTLAATFREAGYGWITDDVLAITPADPYPYVTSSFPNGKLLPDTAAALGYTENTLQPLYANAAKLAYRADEHFVRDRVPLKKIYLLAWGDVNQVTPLPSNKAVLAIHHYARGLKALTSPTTQSAYFQKASQLAEQVPMAILQRQPDLNGLSDLLEFIRQDWVNQ